MSATPSQGTYDPATRVWTVGSVPVSRSPVLLRITALATVAGTVVNTATITRADQYDPNPDNNIASSETSPTQADLAVYKFVDDPRPNVGDTITFTVGLWNYGPSEATSVTVGDVLPAGLRFVDATASAGVYDPGTNVWTLGTVPVDLAREIRALTIRAVVVSPGRTTNTASVLTSDQSDPNPNNNRSNSTVTPQVADLRIGKRVDNPAPSLGDTVEFLIGIGNLGPDGATGVTLQDRLPAGRQLVSATPSQGTYDPATGVWTVGAVAVGDRPTLVIRAVAVAAGTWTNIATIARADQYDPTPGESAGATTTVTTDAPSPTVTGLQRFGYHAQPTELVLTFSTALDASTAEDVANYQLNLIVGRRIGRAIAIASATYDAASLAVSLRPARRLSLFARYRLVVNGSTPTGVAGVAGQLLDGRGDGTPGTDYVATFGREILAGRSRTARDSRPAPRVRPSRPTFPPRAQSGPRLRLE